MEENNGINPCVGSPDILWNWEVCCSSNLFYPQGRVPFRDPQSRSTFGEAYKTPDLPWNWISILWSSNHWPNLLYWLNRYSAMLVSHNVFISKAQQHLAGQGPLIIEASRSHWDTPHSVGHLWTSEQPDAQTSSWQHTTLTRDRRTFSPRDSIPQYQQASGRRSTP